MASDVKSDPGDDLGQDTIAFGEVPGPGLMSLIISYLGIFETNPTESLPWMRKRYGQIVRLHVPVGGSTYLLANPDHVQHVLESNQKNYKKSKAYREIGRVMGEGLLTSEGEKWLRQHRLMMPMFLESSIKDFGDMIVEEARAMVERWRSFQSDGEPIKLLHEMKRIALKVICRALFSSDIEGYIQAVAEDLKDLRAMFQSRVRGFPLPFWVPIPVHRRAKKAINRLDGIVNGLIEDRRGQEEDYDDFLSMLMLVEDEDDGERMNQKQVRDQVMTFFLAGHETTSNALTWTWYELENNPGIRRKLKDHVGTVLNDWEGSSAWELYEQLDYTGRVISESLRKHPPVPFFGREAVDDDVIGSYEVPAGTNILMSQYLIHRDPNFWEDPMEFRPGRFEGDTDRHPYTYFPFGGGARMCIGRELALLEARLILSIVVNEFRLQWTEPETDVGTDIAVTMSPDDPIRMEVQSW